ncbi:uncharacterized protein LOC105781457 [Gossypium raimondii]|uniref:uncharacterized protein LOC105781457 n=1 Tax=Gossypium raimondii TaxID=29730 RepID=UPI00063A9561|nr:uncharacterized protein LOC105781457 [Gossypium raimondii]
MVEGTPVGTQVLEMIGYIKSLEKLGFPIGEELATDVIMQSLSDIFSQFVLNFNMNEINKTLTQLLSMLGTIESNMKQARHKPILMVCKNKGKRKPKAKAKPKDNGKAKPNKGSA